MSNPIEITAPYFEDFVRDQEFDAPAVTLTGGHAALHQALTADRLRLPLDHHASRAVTGSALPLAHPLLITNLAIGQSHMGIATRQGQSLLSRAGIRAPGPPRRDFIHPDTGGRFAPKSCAVRARGHGLGSARGDHPEPKRARGAAFLAVPDDPLP